MWVNGRNDGSFHCFIACTIGFGTINWSWLLFIGVDYSCNLYLWFQCHTNEVSPCALSVGCVFQWSFLDFSQRVWNFGSDSVSVRNSSVWQWLTFRLNTPNKLTIRVLFTLPNITWFNSFRRGESSRRPVQSSLWYQQIWRGVLRQRGRGPKIQPIVHPTQIQQDLQ